MQRLVHRDTKEDRESRELRVMRALMEARDQLVSTVCRVFMGGTDLPASRERMLCLEKLDRRASQERQAPRDSVDCPVESASTGSRVGSVSREKQVDLVSMARREATDRGGPWGWPVHKGEGASPLKMENLAQTGRMAHAE